MSGKVFLVDDDRSMLLLLENAFRNEGFTVASKNGPLGAAYEIRKFRPDVVILDVMMPDLSGDGLAELLSETLRPKPKMIFYSAKSQIELMKIAQEKGADGYVLKTDGPKALVEKVKSLIPGSNPRS